MTSMLDFDEYSALSVRLDLFTVEDLGENITAIRSAITNRYYSMTTVQEYEQSVWFMHASSIELNLDPKEFVRLPL